MKILVVLPNASFGGIYTSAVNFCTENVRRGQRVDLVVMDNSPMNIPNVNQILLDGRASYWDLSFNDIKRAHFTAKLPLVILGIIKRFTNRRCKWLPIILKGYHLKEDYDVVVAYRQCEPCYYFSLYCVSAKKRIALIHGDIHYMHETRTWDFLLPKFDKVACVSNAVSKGFKIAFPHIANKIGTIYNMFDIQGIFLKSKQDCPFKVDKSVVNIVTVARIDPWHKKINRISEVCAMLKENEVVGFHWYVIGDGPELSNNIKLSQTLGVSALITFCGAMDNPFSLEVQCDFSVLTSITEAYSMSLIESKILGKPVVAMWYDGVEEAINNGMDGVIAEQSLDSLYNALNKLINNKDLITEMQQYIVDNPFSNDTAYCQFLELLK